MSGLLEMLPDAALKAYVAAFSRDEMTALSLDTVVRDYEPSTAFVVEAIGGQFYSPPNDELVLKDDQRELLLIMTFATNGPDFALAVHIYWGLCVGLTVEQIAQTLLLAGVYSGVPRYTTANKVLKTTLAFMKSRWATSGAELNPRSVLLALLEAF